MKLQAIVATCLISLIGIQPILCDERYSASLLNNWTCTCASVYNGSEGLAHSTNCSISCHCTPGGKGVLTCICDADGFPKDDADVREDSCFRTCNCVLGTLGQPHTSGKSVFSKSVVAILLLCVMLPTIFLASMLCYFRQKHKISLQSPVFSSDNETSCNSATELIGHKSTSAPKCNARFSSQQFSGCFSKASSVLRSKTGIICEMIIQFSYHDLENATNKFSNLNLLGIGSSSCVYRGQLKDGQIVAVKRFKGQKGSEADTDFLREIELLSKLHHCHVVPLLGYCSEYQGKNAERLLVFEYMQNGNLRDYVDRDSGKNVEWATRVAIALGAARGLEYLHEAAKPRILHRDVKSTNILLDENLEAKITDLGMAKHLRTDDLPSCSSSPVRIQGTFGYFAPEYAIAGRASCKSDVFSFGVVLLELVTGRHPIHKSSDKSQQSLVLWATPRLHDSRQVITELPDPRLKGNFPAEEMQIMGYLAKECLLLDPDSRPSMTEVVQVLSSIAPATHRRYPVNFSQSSFIPFMRPEEKAEVSIDMGEFVFSHSRPNITHPAQCSPCIDNGGKETAKVSSFAAARHWNSCAEDDENLDLMEPRFESFHVASIQCL